MVRERVMTSDFKGGTRSGDVNVWDVNRHVDG